MKSCTSPTLECNALSSGVGILLDAGSGTQDLLIELLEDNNIQWSSIEGMWHLVICDELRIVRGSLVGHRHMRRRMNHSSRVTNQSALLRTVQAWIQLSG